jgi:hypothetical protein
MGARKARILRKIRQGPGSGERRGKEIWLASCVEEDKEKGGTRKEVGETLKFQKIFTKKILTGLMCPTTWSSTLTVIVPETKV